MINPKEPEMTTTRQVPATQNEAWGFYGSMRELAGAAWPLAMTAIEDATGEPLESVRIFLDTSHGRYLADEVHNGLSKGLSLADAIHAAIQRWMGWTIGSQTYKKHGIPQGLPYLTGFVIHCAIMEDFLAE